MLSRRTLGFFLSLLERLQFGCLGSQGKTHRNWHHGVMGSLQKDRQPTIVLVPQFKLSTSFVCSCLFFISAQRRQSRIANACVVPVLFCFESCQLKSPNFDTKKTLIMAGHRTQCGKLPEHIVYVRSVSTVL